MPADTPLRAIKSVAVIGAGTMGGGIAMNFLNAGIPVKMLEMKQEALDRGVATIRKNYEAQVKKGKLKQDKYDQRMALLSTTLSYDDLTDADMVIEAVFEEIGVKEAVFKELDRVMKPGAILASNTSTLDVNKIATFTKRPQDVVGLHFFSPANVMKLLEVVRGDKTAKDVLATVMAVAKKIKKTAVVSGVCDGFIGNRMIEQYGRQGGFLLDEGCTPAQVDKAMEKFGMAMGPFRMGDLAGNDIGWAIRKRRYVENARHEVQQDRRPAVREGPLRPEDRRRLVRLRGRQARRHPQRRSGQDDRGAPQGLGHHAAQDLATRRSCSAWCLRWSTRPRTFWKRALPTRPATSTSSTSSATASRLHRGGPMNYADQVGPVQRGAGHEPLCEEPAGRRQVLAARALAGTLAAEGKTFN